MGAMGNGKDGESKENSALRSVWSTCACSSAVEHLKNIIAYLEIVTLAKSSPCRHPKKGLRRRYLGETPDNPPILRTT